MENAKENRQYWLSELGKATTLYQDALRNGNNVPRFEKHLERCFNNFDYWDKKVVKEMANR